MLARTFSSLAVSAAGVAVVWHMVAPLLATMTALIGQLHGLLAAPAIPRMP